MSSLAQQLQGIASVDAARLTSRTGAPSSKSYLFPPTEAAQQDLDTVWVIAQEGYEQLCALDPEMLEFEEEIFAERTKRVDRMLLNKAENKALDGHLERCLRRLGKWVGVMAGGKCIEWLVRRFRVHEMNVETVIQVFLPYHESPNFPRMLAILTIPATSVYHAPFAPLVRVAQTVPRSYIVSAISPAKEPSLRLLSDVVRMVQNALEEGTVHRALLAFWSATIIELLESAKSAKGVGENTVKVLVEAFVEILTIKGAGPDVNAAVYPPLILLARSIRLAEGPFSALASALITPSTGAIPTQRVLTLLVLLNERKGWAGGLGEASAENLAQIRSLGETLEAALAKYGFEDSLRVVINVMLERPDLNAKHLRPLIETSALPVSLAKAIATGLVKCSLPSGRAAANALLNLLRERHPAIVDATIVECGAEALDAAILDKVSTGHAFADVYSADIATRVAGIKRMFETLDGSDENERLSAREAILARLADQDLPVLQAIYAHSAILAKQFSCDEIVQAVRPVFIEDAPKNGVRAIHLDFLLRTYMKGDNDNSIPMDQLLLPCLLSSDKRATLSSDEWAKLAEFLPDQSPIKSVAKAVGQLSNQDISMEENSGLTDLNTTVITALAEVSAQMNNVYVLADNLNSTIPSARVLAQATLAQVIRMVRGGHQVRFAVTVLSALEPRLATLNLRDVEEDGTITPALLKAISTATGSNKTAARVAASLIASLGSVVNPKKHINWLGEPGSTEVASTSYKLFARRLYTLANSPSLHDSIARDLVRSLFTQFGKDALIFFASVWTDRSSNVPFTLRVAALKHAYAFVGAHAVGQAKVDFQMIVPALVVAMRDSEQGVRSAAVELLKLVAKSPSDIAEVYGLDTLYGSKSEHVQLLKPGHLERYLSSITDAADEIILDPTRVAAIHASSLGHAPSQNKKETGIKRAIISSITSHLVAWQSLSSRLTILGTLEGVHDSAILKGVLPIWSGLLDDESDESIWLARHTAQEQETFLGALGKTLGKATGHALLNVEGESWRFFLGLFSSGPASIFGAKIREMAVANIASGIFDMLPSAQQVPYVSALLRSLHDLSSDEALATVAILKRLQLSPDVLIQLLAELSAALESTTSRKRQRQEDGGDGDKAEQAVIDLTVLIESRHWVKIPGHAGVVASLLALLSSLLAKKHIIKDGVDYLEQEILGAILAVLEKIHDAETVHKAHIGIEPIIKTIRTTSNPRTSQRALLVAAELARLIPDAVLHNVMPIFTFMSSTDVQRDDAYTFGVVEKTVKRIVPVLVSSLRDTAAESGLELWNASAAFVSIFTDMAGRLPKHRTLPFFVHLVESLGPAEYLAPVAMLLIDHALIGRDVPKSKNGSTTPTQAIELALSVSASSSRQVRLTTLRETIDEVDRLLKDLPNADKTAFLSQFLNENDENPRTLRQITTLLHYSSGLATSLIGKPTDQTVIRQVVQQLVGMMAGVHSPAMRGSDVHGALQRCLSEMMKLLGAEHFLGVVDEVIGSGDAANIVIAIDLFTERLPLVKKDIRSKAAAAVGGILRKVAELLKAPTTVSALAAIRAVAVSALPSEDSALASVVLKIVANVGKQTETAVVNEELSLLDITTRHLGPRVIPAIQPMLNTLLAAIDKPSTSPSTVKAAFGTLSALVETVPNFIGAAQLSTLLKSTIQARARAEESSSAILAVCAKKIGTKTIFPVVMGMWKEVQTMDESCMEGYFYLLRLTLKNADRATLPGLIKTVFTFFLDVFDLRHKLQASGSFDAQVITRVESSAIGSFLELVTKLSESAFKPLFTRLYDWAVVSLGDAKDAASEQRLIERKTVLLHVMMGLLTKFRSLLSPYIATLLPHIEELLPAYSSGTTTDPELWSLLMRVLGKSFEVDDGAFWTEALYLKLIPVLALQVSVFPDQTRISTDAALPYALSAMAGSTTSEPVLKALNNRVCMLTREEDVSVRLAALRVLEAVWDKQAEEMVGLVPETVSEYLAELLEDENADVEGLARSVLGRIEKVTGSLEEHLE